jgi:hypothetical protein
VPLLHVDKNNKYSCLDIEEMSEEENICEATPEERVEKRKMKKGRKEKIILGLPWLKAHNPEIDWVSVRGRPLDAQFISAQMRRSCDMSSAFATVTRYVFHIRDSHAIRLPHSQRLSSPEGLHNRFLAML